jgi:hypothetical protein
MSNGERKSTGMGARDSEPRANAGPEPGQALQEQIAQALQPAMAEFKEQMSAVVQRELDETLHRDGRRRQSEARQRTSDRGQADEHSTEREGPRSVAGPELGQALQEQIAQALQPTMAEFKEQMSAVVQHELDETLHRDSGRSQAGAQQASDRAQEEEPPSSDRGADQSADKGRSQASGSAGQRGIQDIVPTLGKPLLEALPEILEEQGEQWLRSRLDQGLDIVFSDDVRAAVQHDVERMLQAVIRIALVIVPERAGRDDLHAEAERLVETLTRDAVEAMFADDLREDLRKHGQQAIHALFHPDLKTVLHSALAAVQALLARLLDVLGQYWEQVLQLLLRVAVAMLQSRLSSILKVAFASRAMPRGQEAASERGDSQASSSEKDSGRGETASTSDESGQRPRSRSANQSDRRVDEDAEPVGRSGDRGDRRPGRAPSGRTSSGRAPSARQTSGRPSSERSPSRRPGSAPAR